VATYNKFESFVDELCQGTFDLDATGDTVNIYLSNAVPSASLDTIKTDLAEIATGNGYTGPEDTQQTWAEVTGTGTLTGTKVVITASGGAIAQFQYVVLYDDTPVSPLDPLIAWWDYGSALDLADGESLTIKFNNGDPTGTIFTIS
jgi:hypothetical protein